MKNALLLSILVSSIFTAFGQVKTTLITERDEMGPFKGTIGSDAYTELYVGQEYTFDILVNRNDDMKVYATNLEIVFDESSRKNSGAMRYKVTPIDTSKCSIGVGVQLEDGKSYYLLRKEFTATICPAPPIFISKSISGEAIGNLEDSTSLRCKFPTSSGIYDSYEVSSWKAKLGDKIFSGQGTYLTKEFIEAINTSEVNTPLFIEVALIENKTGHTSSKGVFIIE